MRVLAHSSLLRTVVVAAMIVTCSSPPLPATTGITHAPSALRSAPATHAHVPSLCGSARLMHSQRSESELN